MPDHDEFADAVRIMQEATSSFVQDPYATEALVALVAAGYRLVHPSRSAEDCEDPWVCCIHEPMPKHSDSREGER